jgi:hypothetical protein
LAEAVAPKRALLFVVLGLLGLLGGGAFIAYSQISSEGGGDLTAAIQTAESSQYLPVVARVNGSDISGEAVAIEVALGQASVARGQTDDPPTPREILEKMIDFELGYQEAERRGLLCNDEEVKALAERQIGNIREGGHAEILEALAYDLKVPVSELTTDPRALKPYGRWCARGLLFDALAPPDALTVPGKAEQFWRELEASLRRSAAVEILDPTLR